MRFMAGSLSFSLNVIRNNPYQRYIFLLFFLLVPDYQKPFTVHAPVAAGL